METTLCSKKLLICTIKKPIREKVSAYSIYWLPSSCSLLPEPGGIKNALFKGLIGVLSILYYELVWSSYFPIQKVIRNDFKAYMIWRYK